MGKWTDMAHDVHSDLNRAELPLYTFTTRSPHILQQRELSFSFLQSSFTCLLHLSWARRSFRFSVWLQGKGATFVKPQVRTCGVRLKGLDRAVKLCFKAAYMTHVIHQFCHCITFVVQRRIGPLPGASLSWYTCGGGAATSSAYCTCGIGSASALRE